MIGAPGLLARVAAARRERERAEAASAAEFAPGFNAVALLGPGETALSAALRWMLDERGSHGQGGRFRDLFFEHLLPADDHDWTDARVSCEAPTSDGRGRIDILVESRDGKACVAVENKAWAGWQPDQLARYLDNQRTLRPHVRVHALIGGVDDASAELRRHWTEDRAPEDPAGPADRPLPPEVTASGFAAVARWIEACAAAARPERVRAFLFDLSRYCRSSILWEPDMAETGDASDLILAGGDEALRAAHAIAAALPSAMARDVARRIGGGVEGAATSPVVRATIDGVPLAFALFGGVAPWAGVTDETHAQSLRGDVAWGAPERLWPKWAYLKRCGEEGKALLEAIGRGEPAVVADRIPAVARVLLG